MNASSIRELRATGRQEDAFLLAVELARAFPQDAELQFEAACVHDFLGKEREAIPYYRAALAGSLTDQQRLRALVGLGSTLRTLGEYDAACETLNVAVREFPQAAEAKVFWAMAMHNAGESKIAIEALLQLLTACSSDPGLVAYKRAIAFYAQDVDRKWS